MGKARFFSRKARAKRENVCIFSFGDARDRGRRVKYGSGGGLAEPVLRKKMKSAQGTSQARKCDNRIGGKKNAVGENLQPGGH